MQKTVRRKTLDQIKHNPTPQELYKKLMASDGWEYKTDKEKYLIRDRALVALLYLGDFRISEVIPIIKNQFEHMQNYILVKDVLVSKKRKGKIVYREAKLPLEGERACFTQLILSYLETIGDLDRLFPWSLKKKEYKEGTYTTRKGEKKDRVSVQMIGTKRGWQIVNALLPEYTQHWLRAFGYNYDYDHMNHDIMAVSDKTKADPISLQPYLRRRYDKYTVQ